MPSAYDKNLLRIQEAEKLLEQKNKRKKARDAKKKTTPKSK
tara:strand:+ start:269 stop:391 length:123 start_codon:yes stop_codon:yes gene_type:complete